MKKMTKIFIAGSLCFGVAYFVYNNVMHPLNEEDTQEILLYK
jgi:hypothetical protein